MLPAPTPLETMPRAHGNLPDRGQGTYWPTEGAAHHPVALSHTQALKAAGVDLVDLSLEAVTAAHAKEGDNLYYAYEMPRELARWAP